MNAVCIHDSDVECEQSLTVVSGQRDSVSGTAASQLLGDGPIVSTGVHSGAIALRTTQSAVSDRGSGNPVLMPMHLSSMTANTRSLSDWPIVYAGVNDGVVDLHTAPGVAPRFGLSGSYGSSVPIRDNTALASAYSGGVCVRSNR